MCQRIRRQVVVRNVEAPEDQETSDVEEHKADVEEVLPRDQFRARSRWQTRAQAQLGDGEQSDRHESGAPDRPRKADPDEQPGQHGWEHDAANARARRLNSESERASTSPPVANTAGCRKEQDPASEAVGEPLGEQELPVLGSACEPEEAAEINDDAGNEDVTHVACVKQGSGKDGASERQSELKRA